ncbi:hypothetical protein D915_001817 [Fasciola hepatica]|uniref:Uncharacterized protein n=1 Tax=Fasciola hepatica TaxID=6192 RepID=A0A4E0S3B9_FASHE|nr:hypothetical protein D915_001817 [Fasciola hepatica]
MICRFHRWYGVCSNLRMYKEVMVMLSKTSLSCSYDTKFRSKSHFRMDSGQPTAQQLLKTGAPIEDKTIRLTDVSTVEDFEQYIRQPGRTSDELLAIDIRPLPPLVRLACLEAFLSTVRKEHVRIAKSHATQLGRLHSASEDNWPTKYLMIEHLSRWSDWELGVNPFGSRAPSSRKPKWLQSPQFELLLLTTTASANRLPLTQLLSLSGHLQHIWIFFDPIVYASVLRLLTSQINELHVMDLLRLASLLRSLPSSRFSIPEQSVVPEAVKSAKDFHTLVEEADRLRSALRLRILSLIPEMESVDAVALFQLLYDLNSVLTLSEQFQVLSVIDSSMIVNPQQRNLYALIFIFTRLSMSKLFKRSVLNRCVGQIHRKLDVAHRFPGNDQIRWFNAVILGLANLSVGAPQHQEQSDDDSIRAFVRPPIMPAPEIINASPTHQLHCGVDLGRFISADWIQQIFTDLTGYVAAHPITDSRSGELHAEVAYALALLGYRANSIIDQLEHHMRNSTQAKYPLLNLIELLVGSTVPSKTDDIDFNSVCRLPRIDWQYYYYLASEVLPSLSPVDGRAALDLLPRYVAMKNAAVSTFVDSLRTRLRASNPLELFLFHRISSVPHSKQSFFADIIFKLQSKRSPQITKVVLCFVCNGRDYVVSRPLNTLLQAYANGTEQLPCITFNYTAWVPLDTPGRRAKCDQFLKDLAQLMVDSPGLPTEDIHLWTDFSSK